MRDPKRKMNYAWAFFASQRRRGEPVRTKRLGYVYFVDAKATFKMENFSDARGRSERKVVTSAN